MRIKNDLLGQIDSHVSEMWIFAESTKPFTFFVCLWKAYKIKDLFLYILSHEYIIVRFRLSSHGVIFHRKSSHGVIFHRKSSHGVVLHRKSSHGVVFHRNSSHGVVFHRKSSYSLWVSAADVSSATAWLATATSVASVAPVLTVAVANVVADVTASVEAWRTYDVAVDVLRLLPSSEHTQLRRAWP